MKVRNGFVSNSSSSSFIVATTDESKVKITVEVNLKEFGEPLSTQEELLVWCQDQYGYSKEELENDYAHEWEGEIYQKMKTAIEKGKTVIVGSFGDDGYDNPAEAMLCNTGLQGLVDDSIEIIHSEGGY